MTDDLQGGAIAADDPAKAWKAARWDTLKAQGVAPDQATQMVEEELKRDPYKPWKKSLWDDLTARGVAPDRATSMVDAEMAKRTEDASRLAQMGRAKSGIAKAPSGVTGDLRRSMIQGLPVVGTFADEAIGRLRAMAGNETPFEGVSMERALLGAERRDAPIMSRAAEIGTNVVGSLPLAGVKALQTIKGASAVGFGLGATQGFGAGEGGIAPRTEGAALSALVGAALPPFVSGASKLVAEGARRTGASDALQRVAERFRGAKVPTVAPAAAGGSTASATTTAVAPTVPTPIVPNAAPARGLLEAADAFERDGVPLDALATRVRAATTSGKPLKVADFGGENVRGQADASTLIPSANTQTAFKDLAEREAERGGRMASDIGPMRTSRTLTTEAKEARSAAAEPAYDAAIAGKKITNPANMEAIADLQKRPAMKAAMATVKEANENEGNYYVAAWEDLPTLHRVRTELNSMLKGGNVSQLPGNAGGASRSSEIGQKAMRKVLRAVDDILESETGGPQGAYATAKREFAANSQLVQAPRAAVGQASDRALKGVKPFLSMPDDEAAHVLSTLSPEAQQSYKEATLALLKSDLADAMKATPEIALNLLRNPRLRSRVAQLFPNKGAADAWLEQTAHEINMAGTENAVLKNSKSIRRAINVNRLTGDDDLVATAADAAKGNGANVFSRLMNLGTRTSNEATANEAGRVLFAPADATTGLAGVDAMQRAVAQREAIRNLVGKSRVGGATVGADAHRRP